MRLGLEKARRRDRTAYHYDPIDDFRPLNPRHARHYLNSRPRPKTPIFQNKTLYLIVRTPTGTLRAEWRRVHNAWGCYEASPELSWMLPLDEKQAGIHLRYDARCKGWSFYWSASDLPNTAVAPRLRDGRGAVGQPLQLIPENGVRKLRNQNDHTKPQPGLTNPPASVAGKDSAPSRGVPIVADGRLVNNAAGLTPVKSNF